MAIDFRYRRLGYVALNVSDTSRSLDFYQDIVGLELAGEAESSEYLLRCSDKHHDVILHQSDDPGLRRVGWEMETAEDVQRVKHQFVALGLPVVELSVSQCESLGIEQGFRATEPMTGVTFEYFHSMKAQPIFEPTVTKIERLGHIVVSTDRYDESEQHLTQELNFRTSDRMNPAVYWLRCFPNPLHHSFAVSRGEKPGLHHVNFMVTDIDDIGTALWRLKNNDVPIVFGPGRHPPSDSVFLYFLDPDKLTLEYSFGMETFPEVDPRMPRDLPLAPESIDYWNSDRHEDFAAHGSVESLASTL